MTMNLSWINLAVDLNCLSTYKTISSARLSQEPRGHLQRIRVMGQVDQRVL